MTLHRQGRLSEAGTQYTMVLAQDPGHAEARHLLGVVRLQQGRGEEAVALIGAALGQKPRAADIRANMAAALASCNRFSDALGHYDTILAAEPRNVSALHGRALALLHLDRAGEALRDLDRTLAIQPGHLGALFHRGDILFATRRYQEALANYDSALRVDPKQPDVLTNRGNVLAKLGRHQDALAAYDKALASAPDHLQALINRGNALRSLERYDDALAAYGKVLSRAPDDPHALSNYGSVLFDLDRPGEALDYFDRALAADPHDVEAINNRHTALLHLERDDEAFAEAERVLNIDPSNFKPHYMFLNRGKFPTGWALYENRWAFAEDAGRRMYPQPVWDGGAVEGPLLVWGEQGLGEQILFASMLADAAVRAGEVKVEVEPRLVPLFARSFPGVQIMPMQDALYEGEAGAHIPLGSLGGLLRPDWESFPSRPQGFLAADAARTAQLRERLGNGREPVIGIAWHSRRAQHGKLKSARVEDFEALFRLPGFRFVDLQYDDTAAEREQVKRDSGVELERIADVDNTNDIDGLAALISACDAVVTVSNTTAHIAGALGKPVWVLVPFGHARMWYWFKDREENPFYASARIRNQGRGQSWADLVRAVSGEVSGLLATQGAPKQP